ncbi:MAG TPA: hypothetical protein PLP17_04540 [Oligoflexia bacterium]|nr:hypothetical protein [Oligoflexia bacterium]
MMIYSKPLSVALFVLLFAAPAFACVSEGYIKTDTCQIQFEREQNLTNLLFENQAKCGLTDKEITWLITNINIYSKVTKETNEQYEARRSAIEAQKIKKTPENKTEWDIIDKKNDCGATGLARKEQFTFEYSETCFWDDERKKCACAEC